MWLRSSKIILMVLAWKGSTVKRLRMRSMLRTVPPISVTCPGGIGGTSRKGSTSPGLAGAVLLMVVSVVVAGALAGGALGTAGVAPCGRFEPGSPVGLL